jgi:hypothetical protein
MIKPSTRIKLLLVAIVMLFTTLACRWNPVLQPPQPPPNYCVTKNCDVTIDQVQN